MGSVMTEKRHYEVHALPEGSTANRRSTDPLRVLVTWTDVDDSDQYKRYANDSADSYDDDDDSDDDSGEDGMEGLWDDEVEIPEAEQDEDDRRSVSSRSVADRKAVVEVINYLDHWYLQKVENNLGLTTTDELIDLQVMKWSGAQAILGDADRVTWDIKIKLFKIEIWRTDPRRAGGAVRSLHAGSV
nr:hypothetical protein BaRGS_027913 [Batillaria attramentaria]